jgi:hypothetical protein
MTSRRLLPAVVVLAAAVAAAFANTAGADSVYHTERLALTGVEGAPGGGFLVNIHANGPKVYAHENYHLRHAVPGTYQATLMLHLGSLDCSDPAIPLPITTIETNARGNGHASSKVTPEDVDGLRGLTVSISWSVTGPAEYVTRCTVVTMD